MKKRIVIFGATGYIGAYFTDYCIDHLPDDYEVVACARRGVDFYQKKDVTAAKVDICRQEDFEKLPTENVYAIVNLTGLLPAYEKIRSFRLCADKYNRKSQDNGVCQKGWSRQSSIYPDLG